MARDGPGISQSRLQQAARLRHAGTHPRTARARDSRAGSTIIGLEHHSPDNIVSESEHAVSHDTDFHPFMLYTPVPGTPLYQQMSEEGRLLKDVDYADVHGQFKFNFKHAAISREDPKRFLDWACWRAFQLNDPSLYRISRTLLAGFKR